MVRVGCARVILFALPRQLYLASWTRKASAQAARGMALLATGAQAQVWFNRSFRQAEAEWRAAGSPSIRLSTADDAGTLLRNVVSEWISALVLQPDWEAVAALISALPTPELLREQAVDVAALSLLSRSAAGTGDKQKMQQVVRRLRESQYAVSTALLQLLPGLWHSAWYVIDEASSAIEKRNCRVAHPVPWNIDFGG